MNSLAPAPFRQAFLINLASTSVAQLSAFVLSLLLARLLTPAELGVYLLAALIAGFAHLLRDFGVSAFLQREPALGPRHIGSALGLLLLTSLCSAALLLFASEPLAAAYGMALLAPTLQVLALGFVLLPFSSVVSALQQRALAATRIAWVARFGGIAHAATALLLAWLGLGPLSLAWATVAAIVACNLAHLWLCPPGLSWRPSTQHWPVIARLGVGNLLASTANSLNQALPGLLLGRWGGASELGLYARAASLAQLFISLSGPAANFGVLPRLAQGHHEGGGVVPLLQRATVLLTGVGWPVLVFCALFGEDLVALLYGAAWLPAAAAIPALALSAALALPFHYLGAAFAATGQPARAAGPAACSAALRLVVLSYLFGGDATSMARGLLLAGLLALPLIAWMQQRWLDLSPRALLKALQPSLLVALACAAAGAVLHEALDLLPTAERLALALLLLLPCWLASLCLSGHPLADALQASGRRFITIRK